MLLFRSMKEDPGGGPLVADTSSGLGIREWEIDIDDDGIAQPETGGMTVNVGGPENIFPSFLPPEFGGTDAGRVVWVIEEEELGDDLTIRPDPDDPERHWFVEPVRPMPVEELREAIVETRYLWQQYEAEEV